MTKILLFLPFAALLTMVGMMPHSDISALRTAGTSAAGTATPTSETRVASGIAQSCVSTHVFNDCNNSGYITLGFNAISGAVSGVADPVTIQRSNMSVGIDNNNPLARLHIKGSGTDSATSSLLINNNSNTEMFRILDNGNVGIGTSSPKSMLAVNGNIRSKKISVSINGWPDYVFADGYSLLPLPQVEEYIRQNRHLPDMVCAKEVEKKGVDLGDNQAALLKKVEELTLYLIEEHKQLEILKAQNQQLETKSRQLETKLQSITPSN